jgi:hypothetical protein
MGGEPSKVKDEDRIKIYKRVTLEDLRRQASLLSPLSPEICSSIMFRKPISLNFKIHCNGLTSDFFNDQPVIHVRHFDDKSLEVDGKECRPLQLIHFYTRKSKN